MDEYKTFVVCWVDWYDHQLYMQQVEALHKYHAIELSDQKLFDVEDLQIITNFEDLKQEAYTRDGMINVLEIV